MPSPPTVLSRVGKGVAVAVGVYSVVIGLLLTPYVQRFALYAHKINTLFWHDIEDPTQFGFAEGQVTPFRLPTPDGETLYGWHILPLDVYAKHELAIRDAKPANPPETDLAKTPAFEWLQSPDARVVISCREEVHGNAGHVAQGWRTDTYRYLISQANTHVLTIDYRGFGKSTGSPTEADLIIDGIALVNWVLNVANIPPERIVLLGQSLGTAVASAVGLQFADPNHDLFLPASSGERARQRTSLLHAETGSSSSSAGVLFSGIVLVAPFSSLPSLLLTYRIGGFLPILMPLRPIPPLARYLTNMMDDKWPTADRLAAYYEEAKPELSMDEEGHSRYYGSLHIIHAKDDADISYHQTEMICQRVVGHGSPKCPNGVEGRLGLISRKDEKVRLRFQILEHGGHNRVVTYTPVLAAVMQAFADGYTYQ